jgi:putative transcriptional regulator
MPGQLRQPLSRARYRPQQPAWPEVTSLLAQGQLAVVMGVSRQTINSIENGRYTPSLPLAIALARYFGVTVEEMFDDEGRLPGGCAL